MSPERTIHLLKTYAATRCGSAFRELVEAYAGLVQATALRVAKGNLAMAQDATQNVFAELALKPLAVRDGRVLGSWLHRCSTRQVLALLRAEQRRRDREARASLMNDADAPGSCDSLERITEGIDLALDQLGKTDRQILTLRFWQNENWSNIAKAISLTEDAAQKRASRALGKLRLGLSRRGITSTTTALVAVLSIPVPPAASASVVSQIATHALSAVPPGGGTVCLTKTLFLIMNAKSKLTILASLFIAAGFLAGFYTGSAVPKAGSDAGSGPSFPAPVFRATSEPATPLTTRAPAATPAEVRAVIDPDKIAIPREMADRLAKGRLFGGPKGRPSELSAEAIALLGLDAKATAGINKMLGSLAKRSLSLQRQHTTVTKNSPEEQKFQISPFHGREGTAMEAEMRAGLSSYIGQARTEELLVGFPEPTSEAGSFFGLGERTITFRPTAAGFTVRDDHRGDSSPNSSRSTSEWDTETLPSEFQGLLAEEPVKSNQ